MVPLPLVASPADVPVELNHVAAEIVELTVTAPEMVPPEVKKYSEWEWLAGAASVIPYPASVVGFDVMSANACVCPTAEYAVSWLCPASANADAC